MRQKQCSLVHLNSIDFNNIIANKFKLSWDDAMGRARSLENQLELKKHNNRQSAERNIINLEPGNSRRENRLLILENISNRMMDNNEEEEENKLNRRIGGLRIMSLNEDRKNNVESPAVQSRIYCNIFSPEEQTHYKIKFKDQILSKVPLEIAKDYNIDDKRIWFRENLNKLRISYYEDTITLVLSRDRIVDETINQFSTVDNLNLHKDIKIFFIDEEARDAGGVIREWLGIVTQHLLKPESK